MPQVPGPPRATLDVGAADRRSAPHSVPRPSGRPGFARAVARARPGAGGFRDARSPASDSTDGGPAAGTGKTRRGRVFFSGRPRSGPTTPRQTSSRGRSGSAAGQGRPAPGSLPVRGDGRSAPLRPDDRLDVQTSLGRRSCTAVRAPPVTHRSARPGVPDPSGRGHPPAPGRRRAGGHRTGPVPGGRPTSQPVHPSLDARTPPRIAASAPRARASATGGGGPIAVEPEPLRPGRPAPARPGPSVPFARAGNPPSGPTNQPGLRRGA